MLAKIWVILTMGGSSSDTTALSLLPSRSHRSGMPRTSVLGNSRWVGRGVFWSAGRSLLRLQPGRATRVWRSSGGAALRYNHRSLQPAEAGGRKARWPVWVDVNLVLTHGAQVFWHLSTFGLHLPSSFHPLPLHQNPRLRGVFG